MLPFLLWWSEQEERDISSLAAYASMLAEGVPTQDSVYCTCPPSCWTATNATVSRGVACNALSLGESPPCVAGSPKNFFTAQNACSPTAPGRMKKQLEVHRIQLFMLLSPLALLCTVQEAL